MTIHPFDITARPNRIGSGQRGVAALAVTMLLLFAMLLVVAVTSRNIADETRASANQLRSTQAFEAAEAGLAWTQARLNDDTRLGDDCLPSADAGARPFRERVLVHDDTLPGFRPATWNDAGLARPQQTACQHGESGWSCHCPSAGVPYLSVLGVTATAPRFVVTITAGAKPGIVGVTAVGCTQRDTACRDASGSDQEATVRIEVALGLLSGLRSPPVAALTVGGDVDISAALGVRNPDPFSGGTAIHAGGRISATALRLDRLAGSPRDASLVAGDERLAAFTPDRLFARWFGSDKATWRSRSSVQRIACDGDCSVAIDAAIRAGHRLLAVDGDATIRGPIVLGTSDRPVVIVIGGAARLSGNVRLSGLLYAGAVEWSDATAGATIDGAVVSETHFGGNAEGDIVRDPLILARLVAGTGTFVRVSGSWKDF